MLFICVHLHATPAAHGMAGITSALLKRIGRCLIRGTCGEQVIRHPVSGKLVSSEK